ncbi:MAG: MATE family efflux transporter, partial [Firmicutes bacterium]|nr:MATE family efflux transporter [Bacillota bacterium]
TGFFGALTFGLILSVFSIVFLDDLVMGLGSTNTIKPYAKTYICFILAAAPLMTTSFILNNILRYEGKAMLGMIGMLTGALLNIAGDPIFMFVFKMGIAGAGLSTALSQIVSFCILLSMFVTGKTTSRIALKYVTLDLHVIFNIVSTGFPSMLRQGLNSITTVMLNSYASFYGDEAVAAMSIVSRIAFFVMSIALGIGQGFQPVCGFNYGAGKYSRVRSAYKVTFALAETLLAIMVVVVLIISDSLIGAFRNDPAVIVIGTRALRLQMMALLFLPFCMITEMMFQSTGKRLGASILSSLRSGVFFIPALIILANTRGLSGIQEAQPIAFVLGFFPSIIFMVWFFCKMPKEDK